VAPGFLFTLSDNWPLRRKLSLVASEKERKLVRYNNKKVQDKGKKLIIHQKLQITKWQAHKNPLGIGSSLAFEKSMVNSEITTTIATLNSYPLEMFEQSTE